jgi:hypothetical protein
MSKPLLIAVLFLAPAAHAQRVAARPSTDPWEVTELTNQPSVTLQLSALNTLAVGRFQVRPLLVIRCQEHELEVFLSTGTVLAADDSAMTTIRLQWGSGAVEESQWNRSTDSMSAFAVYPRVFLQRLSSTPDLRLEIRPSAKARESIRFNARGLERHKPQLASCSPKKAAP